MDFQAFVIFENPLKEKTQETIRVLRHSQIAVGMITGDSLNTAISIATKSGIAAPHEKIIEYIYSEGEMGMEIRQRGTREAGVMDLSILSEVGEALVGMEVLEDEHTVGAMTCESFRNILAKVKYNQLNKEEVFRHPLILRVASRVRILAEMGPWEKAQAIEIFKRRLQGANQGVAYCGDGVNDMMALGQADIGISLGLSEASTAAPFVANTDELDCVPEIALQGKAHLSSNMDTFRFFSLYSLVQAFGMLMLFSQKTEYSVPSYLTMDLFVAINLALCISSLSSRRLLTPLKPHSSILSKHMLLSIVLNSVLSVACVFLVQFFIKQDPNYKSPTDLNPEGEGVSSDTSTFESTVLPS
jgi:cation-transporting ATPase 13A2